MSPRLTSISSASVTTTASPARPSSRSPSNVVTVSTVDRVPAGQCQHLLARADGAGRDRAGEPPKRRVGADDGLDGEPEVAQVAGAGDGDVLEVVEQRRPLVPRRAVAAVDDVVALERRDRDELDVADVELGRELEVLVPDRVEHVLGVVHQVHLIDGHHDVRRAQERGDKAVPLGLGLDAALGVEQDHGEVGGRGARHHVPGVLDVARGVGDDELAPGRGEVAVGHVDRDALLALGAQPVGQERQVGHLVLVGHPARARGLGDGFELVLEDRLRVVEQAADQRALAVVDGARGREPQEVHVEVGVVVVGGRAVAGVGVWSAWSESV